MNRKLLLTVFYVLILFDITVDAIVASDKSGAMVGGYPTGAFRRKRGVSRVHIPRMNKLPAGLPIPRVG